MSLDWLISIGPLPLSFALTGPVSGAIGVQATLVGAGARGAGVTFGAPLLPAGAPSRVVIHVRCRSPLPPRAIVRVV